MKKLDVKNHVLIPKHAKVSEKERTELLHKYNIAPEQLPVILKNDAALIGLNVKPGDIIKIERNSATAGLSAFYRVVING